MPNYLSQCCPSKEGLDAQIDQTACIELILFDFEVFDSDDNNNDCNISNNNNAIF